MLQFPNDYPHARQIVLDVNYRSTRAIVNAAAKVIANNENRFRKQIITTNEQGVNVHIQEVRHPIEESKYVVAEIQKCLEKGIQPSEIAVLFRTGHDARALIETCMEYGISFYIKEHIPNLYEHFIAKNLITYMKMALGDRSRKSFLEIMNRPNRYVGRDAVERGEISFEELRKFYADKEWMLDRIDQLELDLRIIKKCAPYAAIQYIRKHIGYDDFLKEYAKKRRLRTEDLFETLIEIEERAKEFKTIEEWFAHIESYVEELNRKEAYREPIKDAVNFMTMHGAKGLEFDTVFIIGANEDIVPYKKAETNDEIEEERRLFYVAMTRAKERLVISYSRERNGKKMEPSRFVMEVLGV
jgi:DNA helicase-2/ATP-dependent DNA helicase PcrA